MGTKFKIEVETDKKWSEATSVRYDVREDAIAIAEFISARRKLRTRVVRLKTKTIWKSELVLAPS